MTGDPLAKLCQLTVKKKRVEDALLAECTNGRTSGADSPMRISIWPQRTQLKGLQEHMIWRQIAKVRRCEQSPEGSRIPTGEEQGVSVLDS